MIPINIPEYRAPGNMEPTREIEEEPVERVINEKIYVAVGKNLKKNKSLVIWALKNSRGKKICILHVHQPAQMIPLMGAKFHESSLEEQEVRAYREIERKNMHKMLDEYLLFCQQMRVQAEKLHIEMKSIEKGILKLISSHGIRKLVMGAAAENRYSKNMTDIKSKKAISVCLQAPASCQIRFICKQQLIYTKEGNLDANGAELRSSPQEATSVTETRQSNHLRSPSVTLEQKNHLKFNPAQILFRRAYSVSLGRRGRESLTPASSYNVGGASTSQNRLDVEGALTASSDECDALSRISSRGSLLSTCCPSGIVNFCLVPLVIDDGCEIESELSTRLELKEELCPSSPPSVLDGSKEARLYDELEQAMTEVAISRQKASEEAVRFAKAERDAIETIRRVKASESLYAKESRQRKETEEALAKRKEEHKKMKRERDEVMEELHIALDQEKSLESQIADADQMVKELELKITSSDKMLQNYKKERDELQMERDHALKEADELRKSRAEASSSRMPQFFSEFSFSEIEEATQNSNPSLKIGEGGYGSIYKGVLRRSQVAIKVPHSHSEQGPAEYQQEVDVLSKMRHPNLITLFGACPESWALIYEYLPNGSLEDRLSCRDNCPPLSWQTRTRIATELCSVLIFLHSSKPYSIVHGDLKPANVLLDANFVSKLSDFGICRLLCQNEGSSSNTTICCKTNPKGTFGYMDPIFLISGELTPMSDVYSFGIILLRLLTGRSTLMRIREEVQCALDKGNLKILLDPSSGDWPYVQAEQLAHLAVRCCEMNRENRPDLASEVWKVLEPLRASCGGSSSFRLGSKELSQPPQYFICPIFQEIMQDPHVAADGYTYEAEAIRGWLDSGHDTSPMNNHKLAHSNLVPNLALRSAIKEWLQQ